MSGKNVDELTVLYNNVKKELEKNNNEHSEILNELKDFRKELNSRVRKLENWRSFMIGGLSLLTGLVIPMAVVAVKVFFEEIF